MSHLVVPEPDLPSDSEEEEGEVKEEEQVETDSSEWMNPSAPVHAWA